MLFIVKKNSPLIEYIFGLLWGFVVVVVLFVVLGVFYLGRGGDLQAVFF